MVPAEAALTEDTGKRLAVLPLGQPQWPVFAVDGHDVSVGLDLQHFMLEFEEEFLREDVSELFDSRGNRLAIEWGKGTLEPRYSLVVTTEQPDPERLASHLRFHLQASGQEVEPDVPLGDLVVRFCRFVGDKKRRRWFAWWKR
jgi:hypothetical protein